MQGMLGKLPTIPSRYLQYGVRADGYIMFGGGLSACVTYVHDPHHTGTGHTGNYKQHTADLRLVALFLSHLVLVQFFGSQTHAGWWGVLLGSDP